MKIILAIDPGVNGGICILDENKEIIETHHMICNAILFDNYIKAICAKYDDIYCIVESVHSQPTNGGLQNYNFGYIVSMIESIILINRLQLHKVSPQCWMGYLGMERTKEQSSSQWKNLLKDTAQDIYPDTKMDLAISDAVLLARFGYDVVYNGIGAKYLDKIHSKTMFDQADDKKELSKAKSKKKKEKEKLLKQPKVKPSKVKKTKKS